MRAHLLFAAATLFLCPALAQADVVDPEPERCPPGSRPSTAHSGPYCQPVPDCSGPDDRSCPPGGACVAVMQCIETRACGGRTFPDAEPCTLEHVVGPCSGDGTCGIGTCRARDVCSLEPPGGDGGCGCSAAGAPRSLALAPVIALVALLALRRRSPSARGPRR